MKSVGIVDYNVGNLKSLRKNILRLGFDTIISSDEKVLRQKDIVILPGVGSFLFAMKNLKSLGLDEFIFDFAKNKPIIGICLGMQLLADTSDELGKNSGLGLIPGKIIQIKNKKHHIGWSKIDFMRKNNFLEKYNDHQFYFNHGYFFKGDNNFIIAKSYFESSFASIIKKDNVIGFQFHPEKSQVNGMNLLNSTINHLIEKY